MNAPNKSERVEDRCFYWSFAVGVLVGMALSLAAAVAIILNET